MTMVVESYRSEKVILTIMVQIMNDNFVMEDLIIIIYKN